MLIRFVKWCYVIDSGGDPQPIRLHGVPWGARRQCRGVQEGSKRGTGLQLGTGGYRAQEGVQGQEVGQRACNKGCRGHKRDNRGCGWHTRCAGCKGGERAIGRVHETQEGITGHA